MATPAYKLTLLLTRHPDLGPEAFADAWLELERREPLVAPGLVRYVFDRRLSDVSPIAGAVRAPYDGVIEMWWTRKNDAADWVVSREFEGYWLPTRGHLLAGRPAAVGGEPVLVWEREEAEDMTPVTIITLPVAKRSLRFQEFAEHWTVRHAGLALQGPGVAERLVRIESTPAPVAPPARFSRTRYDGAGAITFASAEALQAEFTGDHYREVIAPDEGRFTDTAFSAVFVGAPVDLT